MVVRTQVYQGLLWQQVIDEQQLSAGARLPPLLLLVLYNGARRWRAQTETRELIALSPDSRLWPWQPRARYCLVDIGKFPIGDLAHRPGLLSLLFRLERVSSARELYELLDDTDAWFKKHRGWERFHVMFIELMRHALAGSGKGRWIPRGVWEIKMFKSRIFAFLDESEVKWKAEAKAQGRAEGKAEGKAEALVSLLAGRFGEVAPSCRKRIQKADQVTLDRWFKRAIVATNVRSVFNRPR